MEIMDTMGMVHHLVVGHDGMTIWKGDLWILKWCIRVLSYLELDVVCLCSAVRGGGTDGSRGRSKL